MNPSKGTLVAASSVYVAVASLAQLSDAFSYPRPISVARAPPSSAAFQNPGAAVTSAYRRGAFTHSPSRKTSLQMSFNLPPGKGGGPGSDLEAILPGIVTVAGLVLFFSSPLGGIFFAVTNSLFALAFITPVVAYVAFQIWQSLNTVAAPCPSCGSTVRTIKDDGGQPSICFSCGQFVRTNREKNGVELCNNPNDTMGGGSGMGSLFEELLGGPGAAQQQPGDFFGGQAGDVFGGQQLGDVFGAPPGNKGEDSQESKKNKAKRESTVIDVDIESD